MKPYIKLCLLVVFVFVSLFCQGQTVSFSKQSLVANEPDIKDEKPGEEKHQMVLQASAPVSIDIKIDKAKTTHPDFTFTEKTYPLIKGENKIEITLKTHQGSDKDTRIVFNASYKDSTDLSHVIEDTLVIKNVFPFTASKDKEYTEWPDSKRADIFIGTNFDFFGDHVLTDWYGGLRVFLPSITNLGFNVPESRRKPKFGLYGGIYHSRSFSNFGNLVDTVATNGYSRVVSTYPDIVNGLPVTRSVVRNDTLTVKTKNEINNWGVYIAPTYQWSRFESSDGKLVTNIFAGIHCEVIRRNVSSSITFDTLGIDFDTVINNRGGSPSGRVLRPVPKDYKSVFYDAYFGVSVPIQVLWKDILEFKFNPSIGYGSPGQDTNSWFYLCQFDLLAKLGGLKLNIGGEVRGYLPNNPPILSAYLGTAFSIQKLADFVSK